MCSVFGVLQAAWAGCSGKEQARWWCRGTLSVGLSNSSSIWARGLLCPCSAGTLGVSARRLPCIKWISMRAATLTCRIVQGMGVSHYRFLLGEGHQGSRRGFLQVVCFSSSWLAWAL